MEDEIINDGLDGPHYSHDNTRDNLVLAWSNRSIAYSLCICVSRLADGARMGRN